MIEISLSVNGTETTATVDERCLLVDFLRDQCGLLGARNGCYEARCGCCSVLLDEEVVKSCNVLAAQASGRSVRTVEALTPMGYESIADPTATGSVGLYEPLRARGIDATALHPLQAAFHAHGALQCGFCTAGMLTVLTDYLGRTDDPTEAGVRQAIRGNLCRCTGYQSIVDAALASAPEVRALRRRVDNGKGKPSEERREIPLPEAGPT